MTETTYQEAIRRNILRLREQRGLTQNDLAARAKATGLAWSQATVAAIEKGYRKVSVEEEKLLLMLLEVPLSDLLRVTDDTVIDVAGVEVSPPELRTWAAGQPTRFDPEPRVQPREHPFLASIARRYGLPERPPFLAKILMASLNSVDTKAAHALRVHRKRGGAFEVTCAARSLWSRNVKDERDRRFAGATGGGRSGPSQRSHHASIATRAGRRDQGETEEESMIVRKENKSGTAWKVIVSGTDPATGKRKRLTPVFPTKREAERAEAKLKTELNEGTHVARQNLKLAGYAKDWLPAMKAQVRPSTWESYERNLRVHVIPRIGGVSLQALTPTHLNKLYADLLADGRRPGKGDRRGKGKGLSPRTVAYIHTILHRCLGDAARDGLVQRNVATLARPPKQGGSVKAEQRTWSAAELRAFLSHIEADARPWLYPVVHVAGTTGLRRGEVLGLRWSRVDLDAARLSIQETVVCVGHEVCFSTPKTSKGKRSVPLDPTTVEVLRELRANQKNRRLDRSDLVFSDDSGNPLDPETVSLVFNRRVQTSGLPRIRFHDLRHTFATLALSANVPLKVVSDILGHANISITGDCYSHVIPSMQEDATSRVAALVFGS